MIAPLTASDLLWALVAALRKDRLEPALRSMP